MNKIKTFFRQLTCRHEWLCPWLSELYTFVGGKEDYPTICIKCGKLKGFLNE